MSYSDTQGFERSDAVNGASARKLSCTITRADLVNAVNGSPFDRPLTLNANPQTLAQRPPSNFLPADALLLGPPVIKLAQQFTGGGASSVGVTVGTTAAPSLLGTTFDVLGSAASGLFVPMAQGPQRIVPAGGQLIVARFTPDGAHNLSALTAGSCVIEIYYVARPDPR